MALKVHPLFIFALGYVLHAWSLIVNFFSLLFHDADVRELISTLVDGQGDCAIISNYKMDTADSICPSRVRAMLASRACRTSVMIGDPLTKTEMQKVNSETLLIIKAGVELVDIDIVYVYKDSCVGKSG